MSKEETRAKIIKTFRELAVNKNLDNITVLEIAESCGITPQTFYNHFEDKYQMVEEMHNERFDEICEKVVGGQITWEEGLCEYLNGFIKAKRFLIRAFGKLGDDDSYVQSVEEHMVCAMKSLYEEKNNAPADDVFVFAMRVYADGMLSTIYKWLKDQDRMPVEKLAKYISKAVPKTVIDGFSTIISTRG
ncbi:MAG: TetR family transcriptional regulator [Eubacterium sp.]|nr:TetR family transcriptional regulator [Eubacterium sp.]